ncbi:MAG: VOC family protein [Acidimicrobiales bacterium]|nr:VOC family protein [Acidimicrobiales bacterium]
MAHHPVRLRQVALVAADLDASVDALCAAMDVERCFKDPGVGEFGLDNFLMPIGDTFLEVVSPMREGTTAGRYIERRGGDGGYMAIFQLDDLEAARRRVADAGIRVVWQHDSPAMSGTHLHPADVAGAIVSLDHAQPVDDWKWAGPQWRQHVRTDKVLEICGLEIQTERPGELAETWARVLGVACEAHTVVVNPDQTIRFVAPDDGRPEGIRGFDVKASKPEFVGTEIEVVGVRIRFC